MRWRMKLGEMEENIDLSVGLSNDSQQSSTSRGESEVFRSCLYDVFMQIRLIWLLPSPRRYENVFTFSKQ